MWKLNEDEANATRNLRSRRNTLGLGDAALCFAKLYAQQPGLNGAQAALRAGYASKAPYAARIRAVELLRDPRVLDAAMHYGAEALVKARKAAIDRLAELQADRAMWQPWDQRALDRLTAALDKVEGLIARAEKVYQRSQGQQPDAEW